MDGADHLDSVDLACKGVLTLECTTECTIAKMTEHFVSGVTAEQHSNLPLEMASISRPVNVVLRDFLVAIVKLRVTLLILALVKFVRDTAQTSYILLGLAARRLERVGRVPIMEHLTDQCVLFMDLELGRLATLGVRLLQRLGVHRGEACRGLEAADLAVRRRFLFICEFQLVLGVVARPV